jgi:hypothetical protein
VKKALAAPAIHFKGSGWAKKERRAAAPKSTEGVGKDEPDGEGSGEVAAKATKASGDAEAARSSESASSKRADEPAKTPASKPAPD